MCADAGRTSRGNPFDASGRRSTMCRVSRTSCCWKEMLATTLLRMMEQIAEVPVPPDPIEEDIKVAAPHERAQQRTVDQVVDVCVPCFLAEILVKTSERVVEQFASVRVPQVLMQKKSIMMFARPERVQQLTVVRVPDASVLEPLE